MAHHFVLVSTTTLGVPHLSRFVRKVGNHSRQYNLQLSVSAPSSRSSSGSTQASCESSAPSRKLPSNLACAARSTTPSPTPASPSFWRLLPKARRCRYKRHCVGHPEKP